MTDEVFYDHFNRQICNFWAVHLRYDGKLMNEHTLRVIVHDIKLIASNLEDLCSVYEQEKEKVRK